MKTYEQIKESCGLIIEATKSKTGEYKLVSVQPNNRAVIEGHNENVTAEIEIILSFSDWNVRVIIKDKDGHRVDQMNINKLKKYKKFATDWKKEIGHLIKCPSDSFMKDAFTAVHESNASNLFYQHVMAD